MPTLASRTTDLAAQDLRVTHPFDPESASPEDDARLLRSCITNHSPIPRELIERMSQRPTTWNGPSLPRRQDGG
jgi:hypothetical protein